MYKYVWYLSDEEQYFVVGYYLAMESVTFHYCQW